MLENIGRKIKKSLVLASLLSLPLMYSSCSSKNDVEASLIPTNYESRLEFKTDDLKGIIKSYSKKAGIDKDLLRAILAADIEFVNNDLITDKDKFATTHLENFTHACENNKGFFGNDKSFEVFAEYLSTYGISDSEEIKDYMEKVLSFERSFEKNNLLQLLRSKNKTRSDLEGIILSDKQSEQFSIKLAPYSGIITNVAKKYGLNPTLLKAKIGVDIKTLKTEEIKDFEKLITEEAEALSKWMKSTNNDKYSSIVLNLGYCRFKPFKDVMSGKKDFFEILPLLKDGEFIKSYLESVLKFEIALHNKSHQGQNFPYKTIVLDPGHGADSKNPGFFYDSTGNVFKGQVVSEEFLQGDVRKLKYFNATNHSQRLFLGDIGTNYNGFEEHKLNWIITTIIRDALLEIKEKSVGLDNVVLTRGENQFIPLNERVKIAKNYEPNSTMFLSIHHNSARPDETQSTPLAIYSGSLTNYMNIFQGIDIDYAYDVTKKMAKDIDKIIGGNGQLSKAVNEVLNLFNPGPSSPATQPSYAPANINNVMNEILDGLYNAGTGRGRIVSDADLGRRNLNGGVFHLAVLSGLLGGWDAMLIEVDDVSHKNFLKYYQKDPYLQKAIANAFINGMYKGK